MCQQLSIFQICRSNRLQNYIKNINLTIWDVKKRLNFVERLLGGSLQSSVFVRGQGSGGRCQVTGGRWQVAGGSLESSEGIKKGTRSEDRAPWGISLIILFNFFEVYVGDVFLVRVRSLLCTCTCAGCTSLLLSCVDVLSCCLECIAKSLFS